MLRKRWSLCCMTRSRNTVSARYFEQREHQPLPTRARTIKVKFAALSSTQPGMTRVAVKIFLN